MLVLRNFSELFCGQKYPRGFFSTTRLAGDGANPPNGALVRSLSWDRPSMRRRRRRVRSRASSRIFDGVLGLLKMHHPRSWSFSGAIRRANSGNVARGAALVGCLKTASRLSLPRVSTATWSAGWLGCHKGIREGGARRTIMRILITGGAGFNSRDAQFIIAALTKSTREHAHRVVTV